MDIPILVDSTRVNVHILMFNDFDIWYTHLNAELSHSTVFSPPFKSLSDKADIVIDLPAILGISFFIVSWTNEQAKNKKARIDYLI
ncbi:MAG: hypothetical protein QXI92_00380 [Candidatus Nitrosocaldus sp.]